MFDERDSGNDPVTSFNVYYNTLFDASGDFELEGSVDAGLSAKIILHTIIFLLNNINTNFVIVYFFQVRRAQTVRTTWTYSSVRGRRTSFTSLPSTRWVRVTRA